ncbi:hypothetical protein R1sor_024514 [Riccia sorocarpa]|uniref:Uncharacterized protein n=1 Tax=Riccia sorocarpa TaxID=122646 RepID=A0ABD3GQS5_9MARC
MTSAEGDSSDTEELPLITKSKVGLFVEDEQLLEHLHDFSEFVRGRRVRMRDTLKSGKIRVGVDVKDEKMLGSNAGSREDLVGGAKNLWKSKLEPIETPNLQEVGAISGLGFINFEQLLRYTVNLGLSRIKKFEICSFAHAQYLLYIDPM